MIISINFWLYFKFGQQFKSISFVYAAVLWWIINNCAIKIVVFDFRHRLFIHLAMEDDCVWHEFICGWNHLLPHLCSICKTIGDFLNLKIICLFNLPLEMDLSRTGTVLTSSPTNILCLYQFLVFTRRRRFFASESFLSSHVSIIFKIESSK